jgi:TonB family protein
MTLRRLTVAGVLVAGLPAGMLAQSSWKPALWRSGIPPLVPVQAIAGGEVFVEATVTDGGRVGAIAPLRTTPPFTEYVLESVRDWQFLPAIQRGPGAPSDPRPIVTGAVQSKVLIACVFRPPTLVGPTLGEPPKEVQAASADVAFPLSTVTPPYPAMAIGDAVVMVQVTVGVTGEVVDASILRSTPGFDETALTAARQWFFRPARIHGLYEETFAYLVFAFRRPVTVLPGKL